jgi:pimeloyl-ACP methyl ester carboxylesterase
MKKIEKIIKSFDGEKIWYERLGKGKETIFLVDGIATMGFIWKYIIPYFEDRYQILHMNFRGHGNTPEPSDCSSVTIENSVKDLHAVLEDANIKDAIMIGHSMGVQTIYEFYRQFPENTKALIPICGSYGKLFKSYHGTDKFEPFAKMIINFILKPYKPTLKKLQKIIPYNNITYQFVARSEINGALVKKEDFMPYLKDIRDRLSMRAFGYMLESAIKHSTLDILSKIKVPTLIIAGEKDKMTPMFLSIKMFKLIPNSKLKVLKWGSHTAPIEQPDVTNMYIEEFLIENNII